MSDDLNKVEIIKYGAYQVKIYHRGGESYQVRWLEGTKWKSTSIKTIDRARERAREIVRRVGSTKWTEEVSKSDAEVLRQLRSSLGDFDLMVVTGYFTRLLKTVNSINDLADLVSERESIINLNSISIEDSYQKTKLEYSESDKSERTWRSISDEYRAFRKMYPDSCWSDMTSEFLKKWISRNNPSPQTFNNRLTMWRTLMNRAKAKDRGELPPGEATSAELIEKRRIPKKFPATLSVDEAQKCVNFLAKQEENHLLFAFAVAAFSGMRPSEIQRLRVEHIDLKGGYIHADETVCKKLRQSRYVPILPALEKILKSMELDKNRTISSMRRWNQISLRLRKAKIIKAWPPDVLRHSYISYRNAVIKNINQVADECGNSADVIKDKYRKPITEEDGNLWFDIEVGKKTKTESKQD